MSILYARKSNDTCYIVAHSSVIPDHFVTIEFHLKALRTSESEAPHHRLSANAYHQDLIQRYRILSGSQ